MMKKQSCMKCMAFDYFADYCRLNKQIYFEYVYFNEGNINSKYKEFRPVEKCIKPKNKKQFYEMFRLKDGGNK